MPSRQPGGKPTTFILALASLQATALALIAENYAGAGAGAGAGSGGASLCLADVAGSLGCTPDVAKRTLHSLACGKFKVRGLA